jgi:hypothetical protein
MDDKDAPRPNKPWTFNPWNLHADVEFDGLRLLMLGESHYDDSPKPERDPAIIANSTVQAVRDWSENRDHRGQRFFPYIFETVTGATWAAASTDVVRFWKSIYFYNFVQEFVGAGPRARPTSAMFRRSDSAFSAVLNVIKPDAVLVLGEGLWQSMADSEQLGPGLPQGLGKTYWFDTGGEGRALAAHIRHPSSAGFSPWRWHAPVKEFLELCRREKASLRY